MSFVTAPFVFVESNEFKDAIDAMHRVFGDKFSKQRLSMLGLHYCYMCKHQWKLFDQAELFSLIVTIGSDAEAKMIIRRFFIEQFEVDVDFQDKDSEVVDVSEGQVGVGAACTIIKSGFWSALSYGMTAVRTTTEVTLDWIWDVAKKAFVACLGGYYELLLKAAGWIGDVWHRMKCWCDEMLTQSATWMTGFKECLGFGLGLVGVAAVLVLIEKFMVGSKIIAGPMGLAQTFVLCYVGYIGLREGGKYISGETSGMVSTLIDACKSVVASIGKSMSADGTEAAHATNGQFSSLDLLERFCASLTGFSTETLVKTGRVFNAFSQIKAGSTAVWSCVQNICEYLWNLLDKGFGIRSRALADLSVMLGHDVQGWLKRCDAACEHMMLFPSVPQDILKEFKTLRVHGQVIRAALLTRTERGSAAALTSVNKALEKLTQLVTSATLAGSAGPRYEPLWLAFTGKAGVGKSTAVNMLVARYLTDNGLDLSDFYPRNTTDPFWSGYRRQAVVTYDDLGALSNGTTISEESELIKLVSRDALPLNMAGVEEKGLYFDSSLIVTSSNFVSYSPHAQIHDEEAYLRRRTLLVEIVAKENIDRVPDKPLAHQRYIVRHNKEPFHQIEEFDTFEDFYAYFLDANEGHAVVQKQIMAAMPIPEKTLNQSICAMTQLTTLLMPVVPLSLQMFIRDSHPGYAMLACHGGALYLWNSKLDLKIVTNFEKLVDIEDIKRAHDDALIVAIRYKDVLRSMPNLDPMATHFLADLVEKNAFLENLEVRKGLCSEDNQLFGVADEMPRWQRAFVHVLSSSLSGNKKGIFSHIYDGMCTALQLTYASDVASWPVAVKLGLGMTALLVFGGTMFKALNYLGNFGSGAAFAVAATQTFVVGQSSDVEVRKRSSEYRHRNIPIQTRHWSQGQNFGIGYEWLMKHCLATLRVAHIECQVLMLPGRRLIGVHHFLRRVPDNVTVKIIMDTQEYHICWHRKALQELEGSELSVYRQKELREVSATVADRIVFGLEHLPDTFAAVLCSCKISDVTNDYLPEVAGITVQKRNVPLTIYAGEYQRLVPTCLQYRANTVNKDCGSLIIANINGVDKLVGIHVAGLAGNGQACFLPKELEMSEGQNWFESHFREFPFEEQVGNGTSVVGLLKDEKKFYTQQKSAYVRTPEEWHVGTGCDKEPAILTKFDDRLVGTRHSDYDPYRKGMAKYADEAGPFEPPLLDQACGDIVETWFDASEGFDFAEASVADAINGVPGVDYMDALVLNTSEGYPYLLSRQNNKGKTRFLVEEDGQLMPNAELQAGIDRIERESAEGQVILVGVECAKDEKLPLRKIYDEPKTRLFTVLPMDYNIVVRKKFFPFVRFLMKRRDILPCQVGTNPYGREWGRIAHTLLEKGDNILCCDYSRFDGILPKTVMYKIACMINRLMGGDDRLQCQRLNLLMACSGRYGICAGKVWRVENGIPSGFPLTVILNSVFNEVIVRYLYISCFQEDRLMQSLFSRYVAMVTYGDDNLISVHSTIRDRFSGSFIKERARQLNIGITDGVDKTLPELQFRTLETCDFLKRQFRKDAQGLWRCPMELESLWSQLHWVKTKFLGLHEAYTVNAESVLRELYLHDVGLCRDVRSRILAIDWVQPGHLPSIESIEAFHFAQMHEGKDFSCFAYDALITPAALGPIGAVDRDVRDFEFRNMVATVSGTYKYAEGDFVLCLKVASKYGENGMFVDWPVVSGKGELPVAQWLRTHVIRKGCELRKVLWQHYQAGRRLVFLGRNSNIPSVVVMTLFGLAVGIIDVESSNQILSKAMQVVSNLGYLVDVFPEAFFSKDKKYSIVGGRKAFKVLGAHPYEVTLMRRATSGKAFEYVAMDVPDFVDEKLLVDYVVKTVPVGIVVKTSLEVAALCGLPGTRWRDWVKSKREKEYACEMVATLYVYDAYNVDVFESRLEGRLLVGTKFEDCFLISGVAMSKLTVPELDVVHPVSRAARQFEGALGKDKFGF